MLFAICILAGRAKPRESVLSRLSRAPGLEGSFPQTKWGLKHGRSVKKNQMAMRRSLRYGNSRIDMASYGVIIAQKNGLISTFVQVWVSENVRIMKTIPVGVCYCISMHGYMG